MENMSQGNYARIYDIVRKIPKGRVATYGQIAKLASLPGHARQVGYALHSLKGPSGVPWHRVVNAKGEISRRSVFGSEIRQQQILESEGITFDARGRIPLKEFAWKKIVVPGSGATLRGV
jgi:methylated-DNA-protein-cysteine methyltransferase-like protein